MNDEYIVDNPPIVAGLARDVCSLSVLRTGNPIVSIMEQ